ncbi:MAG TPA: Imm9 family immunity protein [Nocardioides sp.]|uniref:Imm9 family immunity protein n=1 Tax=uncultured Nocardioides sp. TaxID=198441 RepID=UPI0026108498|nr:Imm9 family immunity protein [uncultured Nocardioides sp.]HRD63890.1 Imm9 family immunity protein [Nocardioides sp.]HRI97628.1 Imm9 family immunity protein [Nocardioides sp.]HRK47889.1 Imm9 family immunity protein [Nocardioides sp.]
MKFGVEFSPAIVDLPNLHREWIALEERIAAAVEGAAFVDELPDWEIRFLVLLGKGDRPGVYKGATVYPSTHQKQYTVFVPIPTDRQRTWGISARRFAPRPPLNDSRYDYVEFDVEECQGLEDYILECTLACILGLMKTGIKLKDRNIRV